MNAALVARRLGHTYGTRLVLHDVTLQVAPGEIVGIIGPNGAGKSTCLRLVAGLLRGSGSVHYGTYAVEALSLRQLARLRAFLGQQEPTFAPYTIDHMVRMGWAPRHGLYTAAAPSAHVEEVLAELHVQPRPDRLFARLSAGEQQLVLVARTLLQGCPWLLLDEPQSRLDLQHRVRVMGALRRRAREGAGVVVTLHDLNLAALACDRLLLLAQGRACAEGTAEQVLRADLLSQVYQTPVVCGRHPTAGVPTVELDYKKN